MNYLFLQFKRKNKIFVVSEQFYHSPTNHDGINPELIAIIKTSVFKEFMGMTVHREVNVRHKHINVTRETLIFENFSAKLSQTPFEINNLNLSGIEWFKFP